MAKATAGPKKTETGRNVTSWVEGDKLMIEVDLSVDTEPSGSGKTLIIATTKGNKQVHDGVFAGLNVYRYADKKKGKK